MKPSAPQLVGVGGDKIMFFWDTSTWREVAGLCTNQDTVIHFEYDSSGSKLISISLDGTVRSWIAEESPEGREERLRDRPGIWRLGELKRAEEAQNWYAAAFHLGWLLKDNPDDDTLETRYDTAVAKLKEENITPPALPIPNP